MLSLAGAPGAVAAKKGKPAEAPARAGKPVFVASNCRNSAFEPPTILLACGNAAASLDAIAWQSWTARGAHGPAIYSYKNCPGLPPAACQTYDSPAAIVSLFRPRFCTTARKNHFTRIHIDAPTAAEPNNRSLTLTSPCRLVRG